MLVRRLIPALEDGDRPRGSDGRVPSGPAELIWQLLRSEAGRATQDRATQDRATQDRAAQEALDRLAAGVAAEAFSHHKSLNSLSDSDRGRRDLKILTGRLDALCAEYETSYEDLTGLPVNDELMDLADIQSYVPRPVPREVVVETVSPVVRRRGRLLRRGIVIAGFPA